MSNPESDAKKAYLDNVMKLAREGEPEEPSVPLSDNLFDHTALSGLRLRQIPMFELLVLAERDAQDAKWGQQNHLPIEWLAILTEEVGELAQAVVDRHWSQEPDDGLKVQMELVQVAAVCRAMYECGERRHWWLQ